MSHYQSPELREISRLKQTIRRGQRRSDRAAARADRDLRKAVERTRDQLQKENDRLSRQMKEQEERIRKECQGITGKLNEQLDEQERLHYEKIRRMKERFERDMRDMESRMETERDGMRRDTEQKLKELKQEFSEKEDALDQKIQAAGRRIHSITMQLAEKEESERELADYWLREAERMVNQARESCRPQLIDERKLRTPVRRLSQAREDFAGGRYQSVIAVSRDIFYDALELKDSLAVAELEWNYRFHAAISEERKLLEELQDARMRVYLVDIGGDTVEEDSGIDYWTGGKLSAVEERAYSLHEDLEKAENFRSEDLQAAVEHLQTLRENLARAEDAAHTNVAMMVSRYETACRIGEILGEEYVMVENAGDFFNEQPREEYHAIFQDPVSGNQAAVVITPIPDVKTGLVTNHIELIIGNADNNPVTREKIAHSVAESLARSGIEGCSFPCAQRYGNDSANEVRRVGDIEKVSRGEEGVRASKPEKEAGDACRQPQVIRAAGKGKT